MKCMLISKNIPKSVVRTTILPNLCQVFYAISDKKARIQMPCHVTFPEPSVKKGVWASC